MRYKSLYFSTNKIFLFNLNYLLMYFNFLDDYNNNIIYYEVATWKESTEVGITQNMGKERKTLAENEISEGKVLTSGDLFNFQLEFSHILL